MGNDLSKLPDGVKNLLNEMTPEKATLINILAACILKVKDEYFLLIEIGATEIQPIIAIRLTRAQAKELLEAGVELCKISDTIPQTKPGVDVKFKCVLVVENEAFLVFDVTLVVAPPQPHEIVLFAAHLCPIII